MEIGNPLQTKLARKWRSSPFLLQSFAVREKAENNLSCGSATLREIMAATREEIPHVNTDNYLSIAFGQRRWILRSQTVGLQRGSRDGAGDYIVDPAHCLSARGPSLSYEAMDGAPTLETKLP